MTDQAKRSVLAHNLRFLRKKNGLSQSSLADDLGIRRSNIAAYEVKNVEPRLNILVSLGDYFKIALRDLISLKLDDEKYQALSTNQSGTTDQVQLLMKSNPEVESFAEKSVKIHKVLEGFKAFYKFKKEKLQTENGKDVEGILHDIDNFIGLMEHMLHYNETIINTLKNGKGDIHKEEE